MLCVLSLFNSYIIYRYKDHPRSRGWGMEDKHRWAFDNDDLHAGIEHWKWNTEIQHLSMVARDGEMLFAPC